MNQQKLKRIDWLLKKAQEAQTLTDWEHKFLEDMLRKFTAYGNKMHITDRQQEILEQLGEKD